MAKNLTHSFLVGEQDKNDAPWGEGSGFNQIGEACNEKANEEETNACAYERAVNLTIDLNNYLEASDNYDYFIDVENKGQNKPYVFAMFWWSYTLDKYPGYEFSSPGICSNFIENTAFKK